MKEGYRNTLLLVAWVSVLFLHFQVVKSQLVRLTAGANKQDIKSRSYPQNYPKNDFYEWKIKAPRGYRIRLEFQDFNIGNCAPGGDILEVWNGGRILEFCGQQLPSTIESSGNVMELFLYPHPDSRGGRFWAKYVKFNENELKTTKIYTTLQPTRSPISGDQGSSGSGISGTQRLYILVTMMGCIILAVIATIYCGCKRRRRTRLQSPTPANVPDNADLEAGNEILELNFGDAPPSYEEVTRQSIPDISSTSHEPSGGSTSSENVEIDSSGLPSYREALRLSRQSLDGNV